MERESDLYICEYCTKEFLTITQLRSHKNHTKRCLQKAEALRKRSRPNRSAAVASGVLEASTNNLTNEEGYEVLETRLNVLNVDIATERGTQSSAPFDVALALAAFLNKGCVGGRGLSINDQSELLAILHHPQFDKDDIPYHSGKSCRTWLRRKLESENGPIEVIHYYLITFIFCIVVLFFFFFSK